MAGRKRENTEWHKSATILCHHSRMTFQPMHQSNTKLIKSKKMLKPVWCYSYLYIISTENSNCTKKFDKPQKMFIVCYLCGVLSFEILSRPCFQSLRKKQKKWAICLASKSITNCVANQVASIFNQYIKFFKFLGKDSALKEREIMN